MHLIPNKALCLKQFFSSNEEAKEAWQYEKGDFTKSYICSTEVFKINTIELFWCPNINCQRRYATKLELDNHTITCLLNPPLQSTSYKQCIMTFESEEEQFLNSIGFKYRTKKFCAFDIESVTSEDIGQKKLNQSIISISICASWKTNDPKCFIRKNSAISSATNLVKLFMVELHSLQSEYVTKFCSEIIEVESHIAEMSNMNFAHNHLISKTLQYLSNLKKLICIGWNSERYDLPQLFSQLIAYFGNSKEPIFIIRRGSG